jgi:hypothetical protein
MLSHWLLDNVAHYGNVITVTLDKNHDLVTIFIEKPPECRITFQTTDTLARNIEGVTIRSTTQPEKQQAIELTTNATGKAVTGLIYHGSYVFNLTKYGYDSVTKEANLTAGEQRVVSITLNESTVNLSLTVQDQDGALLENVSVSSVVQPAGQLPIGGVTDESGMVVFRDIKPGGYSFKISGTWVQEELETVTMNLGEASQSYKVSVLRLCALKASVADEQGKTIDGVKVESLSAPLGQVPLVGVYNGDLLFNNLTPGSYTIRFSKDGYKPVERSVTLPAGYVHDVKLIVLTKTRSTILSENILPILALVAAIGVSAYFASIKIRSKPVANITSTDNPAQIAQIVLIKPVIVEPKYFGDTKGMILKAIVIDDKHDLSEIKKHLQIPEQEFMRALYELLKTDELVGTNTGTFNVKNEIKEQWIRFYENKDRD